MVPVQLHFYYKEISRQVGMNNAGKKIPLLAFPLTLTINLLYYF